MLFDRGNAWEIRQPTTQTAQSSSSTGDGSILSPLPGLITSVDIQPGQKVAKGDRLVIVEAMKMEHTLRAPFDGLIEAIKVAVGSKVSEGHLVVIVKAGEH